MACFDLREERLSMIRQGSKSHKGEAKTDKEISAHEKSSGCIEEKTKLY
jgi:hypothetical protein